MCKIKKYISAIMVGMLAFSIAGCSMIERTPESIKNTVLAKVGDEKITKGHLDESMKGILQQVEKEYGPNYEDDASIKDQLLDARKQQLETLVTEKVLLKKAEEMKVIPKEEEIKKEVKEMKNMYKQVAGGTDEKYKELIAAYGMTEEGFESYLRNNVIISKLLEVVDKEVKVSDEEVKKHYDSNKSQYTKKPGANVSHILIKDKKKAEEVRQKALAGEDFAELAKKYTEDTASKDKGGDYGFIEYTDEQYVKEFMDQVKKGKEGEISPLVKTNYGYHIIKTSGLVKKEVVTPFDKVKKDIKEELLKTKKSENQQAKLEQWKKEYNVKVYEDKL